jgi:hypothetical protein
LAFYRERPFEFKHKTFNAYNDEDLEENLITAEARYGRHRSDASRNEQVFYGNNRGLVNVQSMQLFAKAFYENFVQRPLQSFSNFVIVTKRIIFAPTTPINENFLFS